MMRFLVTGGAGFLGSHLCDRLIDRGDEVLCLDNLSTGSLENVAHLLSHERFRFLEADVCARPRVDGRLDGIAHLACAASPPEYLRMPLETLAVGSHGSEFVLDLARRRGIRVLLTSTSEVYGDPLQHPQTESYWGNVNPIGIRSVYDESKRYAEAMFSAHRRTLGTDTGIVRIFNTYGPRLAPRDGRVVSNFVAQALEGSDITVYGDGSQTRSFCYVSDLVRGLEAMLDSTESGPINLGNPTEITVRALADIVIEATSSTSAVVQRPLPADDPTCRCPDIGLAARLLEWQPEIDFGDGLARTIAWQRGSSREAAQSA